MDALGLDVDAGFEEPAPEPEPESDEDEDDVEDDDSLFAAGTVDDEPARLSVR